ncbi:hypothetical protein TNCT_613081 [Trichonephila clavata]|uniref:Uncharacterized protein n=1 Tax=Trichonephila clavata TaxID=2740835 RepID=A0A8X6GNE1_TRICU|nr:hypothetical protein TNCT_613081 [Trichonephila clavata]
MAMWQQSNDHSIRPRFSPTKVFSGVHFRTELYYLVQKNNENCDFVRQCPFKLLVIFLLMLFKFMLMTAKVIKTILVVESTLRPLLLLSISNTRIRTLVLSSEQN